MADKLKQAEFVVTAESTWGIGRGVDLALKKLDAGFPSGEESVPRHGINVKWQSFDIQQASVTPATIAEGPQEVQPVKVPDIALMDIEEARGVVGTAGSMEELDALEVAEANSERTPGGRKGVLRYIEKVRKELLERAAEAEKDAKAKAEAEAAQEA